MKFIKAGATSQSVTFLLLDDDGNVVTGKAAATLPSIYYQRTNEARAQIVLSDAAAIAAVYGSGKVFEVGGGRYRLDLPDAAVATETTLDLMGDTTGMHLIHEQIQVGVDLSGTNVAGTGVLTEGYRATGQPGTLAQLLYELLAGLLDHSISGTTKTSRKIDGTTAKTYTLDDANNPTSITELS